MAESLGLGTIFERESETPGTFEPIGKVASVQPPQSETEVAEIPDLNPPNGVRRKLPGVIDPGELTLTLNFDPDEAGQTTLEQDHLDRSIHKYRVKFPNGKGYSGSGFVSGWAPQEVGENDPIQVQVTITATERWPLGDITTGV